MKRNPIEWFPAVFLSIRFKLCVESFAFVGWFDGVKDTGWSAPAIEEHPIHLTERNYVVLLTH